MLDFIHRGVYVGAIIFFISVGLILILIGQPDYLKPLVSEGMFNSIFTNPEPKPQTVPIAIGVVIIFFSFIIGAIGGFICRFTKKSIIPKKVDSLRAQNTSVFLVDGEIFKKDEAAFYILEDLSRIRVTILRNLYYMELERNVTIAPEGNENEKTILHRDNEIGTDAKGEDADNKEGEDNDKPFK